MKKRRNRTKKLIRSPVQFHKLSKKSIVPSKSQSFQELKRRYIIDNVDENQKYTAQENEILSLNNKHTFDSLESFLNAKKIVHLFNIKSQIDCKSNEIISGSSSSRNSNYSQTNLFSYFSPLSHDYEPNILHENYEIPKLNFNRNVTHLEGLPFQQLQKNDNTLKMAEIEKVVDEEIINEDEGETEENIPTPPSSPEEDADTREDSDESTDKYEKEDSDSTSKELTEILEEVQEDEDQELSNNFDLSNAQPGNLGDLFSVPFTDATIFKEMVEASSRSATIEQEIEKIQQELKDLQQKGELDGEDEQAFETKYTILIEKMSEFDMITKKIQESLGLVDSYPDAFSMAYETLDLLPKSSETKNITQDDNKEKEEKPKKILAEWQAWEEQVPEDDRFDLPQQEYPEDRLPRVIVCGYTEDELPKIAVADSVRRPKVNQIQCLEKITGKLAEALNVQEKLVKENVQLENGKYKLEEALIEKDSIADTLERKVYGLQAEMRMIVKENSELSHQLAALNERLTNQLSDPPRTVHHSPLTTACDIDKSYRCLKERHNNVKCVSSRDNKQQNVCSPRLGGGGGGSSGSGSTDNYCNCELSANINPGMCCQNLISKPNISLLGHGTCPAEMENKLSIYETNAKQLTQQLDTIESEVDNVKIQLANVNREYHQLEQQKKLFACTAPCAPCPCTPSTPVQSSQPAVQLFKTPMPIVQDLSGSIKQYHAAPKSIPSCTGSCIDVPMGGSNCPQQQLRDLREQYSRLQEDYKNKLTEVSCLRTDAEKMKYETREAKDAREKAENRLIDLEERMKMFESDRNRFNGSKEQTMEQEQTLIVTKQRYREAQDELEELRILNQDQSNQLEDYRNKYLQAQEQVEEQRYQIELMEMDNARMNENVTLEIGRIKNKFQEKLFELTPLPDILKQTQIKLQESQQMRLLAERNCDELARELLNCKNRIGAMTSQSEILRTENAHLKGSDLDNLEDRNRELKNENERLRNTVKRMEEREIEHQKRLDDKKHEIAQLSSMLEQVREDSAQQVARTKERCEAIRKRMQGEISEMEKQLVQCRATAKAAQKDSEEIRKKMQSQINHLTESFDYAQTQIKNLQGHVNYLKPLNDKVYRAATQRESYPTSRTSEIHPHDACNCNY